MTAQRRSRRRHPALLITLALLAGLALAATLVGPRLISSRSTQLAGDLVQRVETDEPVVALTFDDGPTDADADAVLNALAERGVRATFYLNGKDVERNQDTVRRIIDGGHEIGNHTWSHRRMVFVTPETVADEIESTDRVIREAGYDGPLTFRPPYGQKLLILPLYLAENDQLTVTWDVTTEDFTAADTRDTIIDKAVSNTQPGSIILMHPWWGRTATQEAIGPVLDQLQEEGYRFVTVSELLDMAG
jgi:peptidoglycan-N-acetylglucosamine deacetylase